MSTLVNNNYPTLQTDNYAAKTVNNKEQAAAVAIPVAKQPNTKDEIKISKSATIPLSKEVTSVHQSHQGTFYTPDGVPHTTTTNKTDGVVISTEHKPEVTVLSYNRAGKIS